MHNGLFYKDFMTLLKQDVAKTTPKCTLIQAIMDLK